MFTCKRRSKINRVTEVTMGNILESGDQNRKSTTDILKGNWTDGYKIEYNDT